MPKAPEKPRHHRSSRRKTQEDGRIWLYGRHAVSAALANRRRTCFRLLATEDALARIAGLAERPGLEVQTVPRVELDRRLGEEVVHQGLALMVAPLPRLALADALADGASAAEDQGGRDLVLVLDQINDPHNLGAILRSAAAFAVRAVVIPTRRSADLGGAAAKAASGALDLVPLVEVPNLAAALEELKDLGYWRLALDGHAETTIGAAPSFDRVALLLGAEGSGLRRLLLERADLTISLPIAPAMESLNVSVAAGIALYALSTGSD
jgi:23S rRNA (guanosine2251-2'-O)-methyltransferase